MTITSTSNEKVKHARRVRDGKEPGLLLIEGLRLAEEAVKTGLEIQACFHLAEAPGTERREQLLEKVLRLGVHPQAISGEVLQTMSDTVHSQGILLLATRPRRNLECLLEAAVGGAEAPLILALDRVQDPGNVGTLIRTAEAAGVAGILSLKGSADAFAPKTLRSAMGSAFRLPLVQGAGSEDLQRLRHQGYRIVAATGEGETDYALNDWRGSTVLLVGNEGQGVAPELMAGVDARLRIPMSVNVESLNVAAAGAVMLFEAARQRRLQ